jgi:hypothetical protein
MFLFGGVSYKIHSPCLGRLGSHGATRGRQLFAEHASMAEPVPLDLAQQTGPQIASHADLQGVRYPFFSNYAYIDTHIVRSGPADCLSYASANIYTHSH